MIQASQPEIGASQNLRFGVYFPLWFPIKYEGAIYGTLDFHREIPFPMEKSELSQRGVVQEEGQLSQGA